MHENSQQRPPAAAECPPLEELACLVDGVLSPQSAEATLGHILACPKCYEIYVGLLRFELAHPSEGLVDFEVKAAARPLPLSAVTWRVAVDFLETSPSPELSPEEAAMAKENKSRRAEIFSYLQEAIHSLSADERLFVRLHFVQGLSIAEIARIQKLEQKSLHRSREKILRSLHEYRRNRGTG